MSNHTKIYFLWVFNTIQISRLQVNILHYTVLFNVVSYSLKLFLEDTFINFIWNFALSIFLKFYFEESATVLYIYLYWAYIKLLNIYGTLQLVRNIILPTIRKSSRKSLCLFIDYVVWYSLFAFLKKHDTY